MKNLYVISRLLFLLVLFIISSIESLAQEGEPEKDKEILLVEKTWSSPDFKAISHEIKDLRINLSRTGDVAWFYCVLDDINEWKGEPASWLNVRWTGVLEKRDGKWVIVQMHFSNPV